MTRRAMHDLSCTCGRHFRRVLYHAVDVGQQPGLRYAVLADLLNTVQCPSCERVARVNLPLLYSDASRQHFVYVYPEAAADPSDAEPEAIVPLTDALQALVTDDAAGRPTLLPDIDHLIALVQGDLEESEEPGAISIDVRPGIKPERVARLIARQVATQTGGFVHSWREGGRLHLQIVGPRRYLQAVTITVM